MKRSDPLAIALRNKPHGAFAVVGEEVFNLREYTMYLGDDEIHTSWEHNPYVTFPPSPRWWFKHQWARLRNAVRNF